MKNNYYFIEDLDVSGDKIPDGVLVRQYSIDFDKNLYNYKKNSYLSKEKLKEFLLDIQDNTNKTPKTDFMVSNSTINKIRNKRIPLNEIPRVIISKKSYFAHLLKGKSINIDKLVKDLNKLFSKK